MNPSFLGIPDVLWGVACGLIATVFAVIWPIRPRAAGNRVLSLRWLHPLVWTLLAVSFFLRSLGDGAGGAANVLALLAAIAYAGFVGTMIAPAQGGSRHSSNNGSMIVHCWSVRSIPVRYDGSTVTVYEKTAVRLRNATP